MKEIESSRHVCLVCIAKDEEKFLDEWLVYHKMIGIDHFFIYDDNHLASLATTFRADPMVTVHATHNLPASSFRGQIAAYQHAIHNYISDYEWVIFLDVDEFIVLRSHNHLRDFLNGFSDVSAISLNWHVFGHNGHYDDPEGLVTAALTRRMFRPSSIVKTFTRTDAIAAVLTPHFCELKYGYRVDANKERFTNRIYPGRTDRAHINHYQCRSFTRWMARVERGDVNFNKDNSPKEHSWRFTPELCLKQFVTTVALDKNEHIDKYMLRYKSKIEKKLFAIKQDHNTWLPEGSAVEITGHLKSVTEWLAQEHRQPDTSGLSQGKMGLVVYLFQYGEFSGNKVYTDYAENLLEKIIDDISSVCTLGWSDGLSGIGAAIAYLIDEGFLNWDADEMLEETDNLVHIILKDKRAASRIDINLIDLGLYLVARITGIYSERKDQRMTDHHRALSQVVAFLPDTFSGIEDITKIAYFLLKAHNLKVDQARINHCLGALQNACKQYLLYDNDIDWHVSAPGLALTLFDIGVLTADIEFKNLAEKLILRYQNNLVIRPYAANNSPRPDVWKLASVCKALYNRRPHPSQVKIFQSLLKIALEDGQKMRNAIIASKSDTLEPCLQNGYTGAAMGMLSLLTGRNESLTDSLITTR